MTTFILPPAHSTNDSLGHAHITVEEMEGEIHDTLPPAAPPTQVDMLAYAVDLDDQIPW